MPASHTAQLPAPVVRELYWPATQAVHSREVVAPAGSLYAPAGHAVHPLEPVARALYEPASQRLHAADDVAPVKPL